MTAVVVPLYRGPAPARRWEYRVAYAHRPARGVTVWVPVGTRRPDRVAEARGLRLLRERWGDQGPVVAVSTGRVVR